MSNNVPSVPPELASILATLSQFAPVQTSDHVPSKQTTPQQGLRPSSIQGNSQDPRIRAISRSPQPQQPLIDPATITDWSAGLRCVAKIAAQNQQFSDAIKKMIQDQRKHEMQWYSSRQALKQDQAKRGASSGELSSILKSLGGASAATDGHQPQSQEEKAAELLAFDTKIYRAQAQMAQAMTTDLKVLGVPFFGTRTECVVTGMNVNTDSDAVRPKWSPLITQDDLKALQQRMIKYLEDMYKD